MILGKFTGIRSFGNVILSSGIRLLSPYSSLANHPLRRYHTSFAKNCHYAYTYDEVHSPVSIGRIDEADEVKEERWKVISASFHPSTTLLSPISVLLVYIPPSHSPTGIRSRSNVCTFGIRVLEVENVELYYTGGERVSSTQSRVFALTGSLTTPVSGIKGAGY